jgi:hypothetical protein
MSVSEMAPVPYFTSIGCNRDGRCLKWDHSSNLIAYAGANLISIYNVSPAVNTIIATMKGHTQDLSTLNFFPQEGINLYKKNEQNDLLITKLVSGCFGGKVCIFDLYQTKVDEFNGDILSTSIEPEKNDAKNKGKFYYKLNSSFDIDDTSILHLQVVNIDNYIILVVATSTGGVYLYAQDINENSPWYLLQEIYVPVNQLIQTTAFSTYPHPTQPILLLALGGVDGMLTLLGSTQPFLWPKIGKNMGQHNTTPFLSQISQSRIGNAPLFTLLGSLKGHRDWIRDIAFSPLQYDPNTDQLTKILLATGSQDKTIRILSIQIPPKTVLDVVSQNFKNEHNSQNPQNSQNSQNDLDNNLDETDKLTTTLLQSSTLGENGHLWSVNKSEREKSNSNLFLPQITPSKEQLFLAISLETVLFGHENWVMSLEFFEGDDSTDYRLTLLSVSTDRTIIEWIQQDFSNSASVGKVGANNSVQNSQSLWVPAEKIGEGLGYLCYYGGVYGPNANAVVAVAYNGSLSMWNRYIKPQNSTNNPIPRQAVSQNGIIKSWYPIHCPTGHNKPVLDVLLCSGDDSKSLSLIQNSLKSHNIDTDNGVTTKNWNGPILPYFLTLSQDQTTRAYAPFVSEKMCSFQQNDQIHSQNNTQSDQISPIKPTMVKYPWYELARAQIHGWDLCGLTGVNSQSIDLKQEQTHRHEFFSVGEEKVLRLFRAPALFIAQLYAMTSDIEYSTNNYKGLIELLVNDQGQNDEQGQNDQNKSIFDASSSSARSLCAVQPKLGLSNKPLLLGDEITTATELEVNFGDSSQSQSLTIEMLLQTLPTSNFVSKIDTNNDEKSPLCSKNASKSIICPPYEEQLSTTTLWSEVDKLYGHGYDISTITTTHNSHLQPYQNTINFNTISKPQIFSANHARKQNSAGIRQWARTTGDLFGDDNGSEYWVEQDVLYAHQQTISAMKPSYDNHYLLSVGRDMQITVFGSKIVNVPKIEEGGVQVGPVMFKKDQNGEQNDQKIQFKPVAVQQNGHTRQIFNCSWVFDGVIVNNGGSSSSPEEGNNDTNQKPEENTLQHTKMDKKSLKYFTTCGRDKTIKVWCYNPHVVAAKSLTLVQTIKVQQVPTALYSATVMEELPICDENICAYFEQNKQNKQNNIQNCTNYLFVGFENGDISVYKSILQTQLVKVNCDTGLNTVDTLPYAIVAEDINGNAPKIVFEKCHSFHNNISHNSTVNKITAYPSIVNKKIGDIYQQKNVYFYQQNSHLVLVSVSNDHSVKMFGIDL